MTIESDTTAVIKQANNENLKKNRIQVSNTKKPLFFYVNLAKVIYHIVKPLSFCLIIVIYAYIRFGKVLRFKKKK